MRQLVLYIHGKGGNAMEADHYKTLFAGYDISLYCLRIM